MEQPDFLADRQKVLKNQIETIVDQLSTVSSADRPRFPERYFQGIFLPYFAGDEHPPYPTADTVMWIGRVAGSPFQEVDIIDASGAVLFTVPPMMDRGAVDPKRATERGGPSLGHIIHSAQQYALMSPSQGSHYLQQKLTEKALIMKVPSNVLRNIEAWNHIFERYGRPPLMPLDNPAPSETSKVDSPSAVSIFGADMDLL